MKKLLLALLMLPLVVTAGDFGKEAGKTAKRRNVIVRENPETGERVEFDASKLDKKTVDLLTAIGPDKEVNPKVIETVEQLEKEQKGTLLVANKDKQDGSAPTTAWWVSYIGYFPIYSVSYVYVPVTFYWRTYTYYFGYYRWW